MIAFVARRLVATIPVMGVVVIFVFLLIHLAPGDPAAMMAGEYAKPADIERIRQQLGLDRPLYIQFLTYFEQLLSGNLGVSVFSQIPVTELIGQRMEPTLLLSATTLFVTIVISIPIGVFAAWKAGTWMDHVIMALSVVGFSVPVFIFAYILIFGFALKLPWFPVQGYVGLSEGIGPCLYSLTLPTLTLCVTFIALLARITRASMLEILQEDYVKTAYAKGAREGRVLMYHGLKNAAVPIMTVIGLSLALLIGGVVVTESVYNIPGLGRLTVDAVLKRDFPIIQGIILLFAFINVVINLLIDISYTAFDPRIRY